MNKYTSFIFKYKKALVITFFILNIVSLIGITRIKLNTDFSMFAPNESIYQDKLDELEEVFSVALIVGGSIVIPHLRRAVEFWGELKKENKKLIIDI